MTQQLELLQCRLASADFVSVSEPAPGFIQLDVKTDAAVASIALNGAQLLSWQPQGEVPVVWLSKAAQFVPGKSSRGGVPVCWPWFGPHATESTYPAHGVVRTRPWVLLECQLLADGRVQLVFEPEMDETARTQWPHPTALRYQMTIGETLSLELLTTNNGPVPVQIGQALHTYFEISDIDQVSVDGLAGCTYIDRMENSARKQESGAVRCTGETDRVYLNTPAICDIHDRGLQRRIQITATGSRSTVVWNPWIEKAEKMGDLGPEGYRKMLCVETANAADDVITLVPGATHCLGASYRCLPLA